MRDMFEILRCRRKKCERGMQANFAREHARPGQHAPGTRSNRRPTIKNGRCDSLFGRTRPALLVGGFRCPPVCWMKREPRLFGCRVQRHKLAVAAFTRVGSLLFAGEVA